MFKTANMKYRQFGKCGLKLSAISLGVFINSESTLEDMVNVLKLSLENGINHFDTAEIYSQGQNQVLLGQALKQIGQDRQKLVISTKVWTGQNPSLNSLANTNKKHVKEAIKASLKRLQMDYVDIIYAHSCDYDTPLEQICRAFHEVIEDGDAFYWGTSNWDADVVVKAMQICEKYNLHKPIGGQNYYNMAIRKEAEEEYRKLFETFGYGLVAFAPLMGGFLTGKYLEDKNADGRFTREDVCKIPTQAFKNSYFGQIKDMDKLSESLRQIKVIALKELNCNLTQLAIAWVLKYKHTSAALIGVKNVQQMEDALKGIQVVDRLTNQVEGRINKILGTHPPQRTDWRKFTPEEHIRSLAS